MAEPNRYEATLDGGTLHLVGDDDRVEVGPMDGIVEVMGGETYTLEYTDEQAGAAWLRTGDEASITLEVRDALLDWGYTPDLVENVRRTPRNETGESGYSYRLELFVDLVTDIWDAKGDVDEGVD